MSIWTWSDLLEAPEAEHRTSLGEGHAPVVRSTRVAAASGFGELWFKCEGSNPTGSYKDRFAAAAISHMRAEGRRRCVATSSGNTGAALAAYCAAAGIGCQIAIVESTPPGKLVQMLAYGAQLYRVKGFGLDAGTTEQTLALLADRGRENDAALQISAYCYSPLGMEGVQSMAYELAQQLEAIDHVFVPAGGGGLTLAIARGFETLVQRGLVDRGPRIHCVQPAGNATIAAPLRDGNQRARRVECATRISGLQVPVVLDGDQTIAACRASGGTGHVVADDMIFAAQRRLAREEGVFSEPAGAAALAGALQALQCGEVSREEVVVCIVTGSGFKDPASAEALGAADACRLVTCDQLAGLL